MCSANLRGTQRLAALDSSISLPKLGFIIPLHNCALMSEITQPIRRVDRFQSVQRTAPVPRGRKIGCWPVLVPVVILVHFFAPFRTNILLLGTDDSAERLFGTKCGYEPACLKVAAFIVCIAASLAGWDGQPDDHA